MDKKTVTTISYLSRLKIDAEKEEKITNDLENIIEFVDKLNDVDTSDIELYVRSIYIIQFIYKFDDVL